MDYKPHDAFMILIVCVVSSVIKADDSYIKLSASSEELKFVPQQDAVFRCTVLKSRTGNIDGVQWFRRQGTLSLKIATEVMPSYDFNDNTRYTFNRGIETSTTADYYLTIKNLSLEDSSTLECGLTQYTKQKASLSFAVCTSPETQSCDCLLKTGWASPECFDYLIESKEKLDKYNNAVIGLGVGLAFANLLAISLTVWLIISCVRRIHAEIKKKEAESARSSNHPPPAVTLGPPGASALRQASQDGAAQARNVRFSEVEHTRNAAPIAREPDNSASLYPNLYFAQTPPDSFYQNVQRTYTPLNFNFNHTTETNRNQNSSFVDPSSTSV